MNGMWTDHAGRSIIRGYYLNNHKYVCDLVFNLDIRAGFVLKYRT